MKNRNTVVVVFLLVAVMLLGVGYAALTDTLTITGNLKTDTTVAMDEFNTDVYFSAASIVQDDTGTQSVAQILEGRDDGKIEALHFTTADQVVVAKYTITNEQANEFAASIKGSDVTITNNAHDHAPIFSAVWSWSADAVDHNDVVLQPGESQDLYITITLLETPQEIHEAEFSVSYVATAVDAEQGE